MNHWRIWKECGFTSIRLCENNEGRNERAVKADQKINKNNTENPEKSYNTDKCRLV